MDRQQAMNVMERLDIRVSWSDEEFEQCVREAEAEGAEPLANPHVFAVRLDARDDQRDFERGYRVRVTPGEYGDVGYDDWRAVIDLAEEFGCHIAVQNNGIELA
jgi:hypothetical protein